MMETNDLIQWLTVSVIILIALIAIVRKVNKLRRNIKDGDASGCGCGCGCGAPNIARAGSSPRMRTMKEQISDG